ncbi:MAG: T9SS type A sorting domain-containing protein [Bacteroidales bacterium]|nr:T9SS type A sorting domain-containing protein [Bacteroidales bacterium]
MKKKLLMGVTLFLIALIGFSQGQIPKELLKKSATTEYTQMNGNEIVNAGIQVQPTEAVTVDPTETVIGNSFYDLWSNTMYANRFYRYEDGTMAAVWIMGFNPTAFDDRGTGYNYFDGTSWGPSPTERIENIKCGWPSYAPWGETGEINVAHNGVAGLEICTREAKGTGDWVQANYAGPVGLEDDPTWPRIATTGENNEVIHMFYNSYVAWQGQTTALLYSRSMDGGETWDPRDVILDGMGEDYYTEIGADDYVLAAEGNTVMLLVGGAWNDMFIMKSEDNGDTWDKTIVWEHPYPRFDWNTTITDTFFCCDNSASIAIDPSGKAHVVFGIMRVLHDAVGTTYSLWPYTDGIGYWNEDMDEFSNDLHALSPPEWGYPNSEMEVDYNLIGWSQDVDGDGVVTFAADILYYRELGVSTMPTITIDDAGYIWVLFASTTETYVYMDYNYKHIWARGSYDGDWGEFHDLTESIFHLVDECIYPLLSSNTDGNLHYFYQLDQIPGLALDEDHEYVDNTEVYGTIDKNEIYPYVPFNTQTIDIEPGFQFVSTRIAPVDPDMTVVAADIMNDDLQYIRNSTGAMLRKIGPNWVNGIGDWIGTEGYLIKTSAVGEFTISGTSISATTPISLLAGFQFVSYLPETEISATDAFATIIGDDLLYVRNSTGAMLRKIGPNWVNGIGNCIPTEGYLIKMAANAELVYPASGKSSSLAQAIPSHLIFEGGNAAEAVYTMYVDGLEIGDEVAAYNGNVILGSMTVISNNVFDNDLAIFSELTNGQGYEAGEPISLKVWSNGNVFIANFEMESVDNSYVSNVYPNNDGEYSVVNISKGTTLKGELVIYPNPATDMINISSPNQINNVSIFNNVGQLVYEGNSNQINTSNFDAGVYIIRVETTNGMETQKVTIK